MSSNDKLRVFERLVQDMDFDEPAEQTVRDMIAGIAANCPTHVLAQLAGCVIECRRSELRSEAGMN